MSGVEKQTEKEKQRALNANASDEASRTIMLHYKEKCIPGREGGREKKTWQSPPPPPPFPSSQSKGAPVTKGKKNKIGLMFSCAVLSAPYCPLGLWAFRLVRGVRR